ncbi:MAG: ketoacyl-ACP synthase III [bacterium]|nr:ketoacyl-ACP synthase III [bacterium]MDT8396656.1 beta-ketoacyl-ACP synthase III [bacterium]
MKGNRIIGTGMGLPSRIVTNDDLAKIVDTTDEWIVSRTGIRERRIAEEHETTSDFAAEAAKNALEMAGVGPEEVDLVIMATLTPDRLIPATACIVQSKIGAVNAACFDLEAACSGFVYGLAMANGMMPDQGVKTALVIGGETLSRVLDWSDRNTCVLFADGAGAAVLRHEGGERGIISTYLKADGSAPPPWLAVDPGVADLTPLGDQHSKDFAVRMMGREVFKFGVRALPEAVTGALERAERLTLKDIDMVIPHQANIRIIDSAAKALGIPRKKFFVNLEKYGNTSGGTIPIALDDANRQGLIKEGDIVALAGFGAGLTWGGAIIRW